MGLISQLSTLALGPILGSLLGQMRRDYVLALASSFQSVSIFFTAVVLVPSLQAAPGTFFGGPWYLVLILVNVVERQVGRGEGCEKTCVD